MPDAPFTPPSRYRILNRLGSGGMGDVYAALDETLQRRVAIKAIRAARRLNDEARERFLREARILSQLDHPNICRAYDYIRGEDSDWLVMELVTGRSLSDRIKLKLTAAETATIAEQVAAVLVVTHAAGIVHRDLKPGNIVITESGNAKVLDFGLARSEFVRKAQPTPAVAQATEAPSERDGAPDDELTRTVVSSPTGRDSDADETQFQTRHHSTMGTLPYMSPEQARAELVTSASDMFSFGLVLQEMLTGRRAYAGTHDSEELIERVQHAATEPLTGSGDLVALVRRLTSLAPSQRPTALEAVERLRWIREAPKRRLRRAAAAAAIVLVVLAGTKYTLDLRRERTDASRRRGQAEDLIGFMLGDLRTKLEKVGRLDVLDAVGAQAMSYFASVPASALTGEELSRRAQTLYQIGSIRQRQGDLTAARAAYDESLAVATQLSAREPSNPDWQLRLATAHFYTGDIRRRENDLAGAMREFTAYRDIAAALAARDPNNLTWALELSYGQGGVAAVQELQGDLAGARTNLELALATKQTISTLDRKNSRQHDLGVAHNRLGLVLAKLGDFSAATDHYKADLAIRRAMVAREPSDQSIKRPLVVALDFLGAAHEDRGELEPALEHYQAALNVIAPLSAGDPLNADWQRDRATCERRLGDMFSLTGRTADAQARYQHARATLAPSAAAAPTDITWQRDLAKVELGLGAMELALGGVAAAREAAANVERVLLTLFQKKPDGETARLIAEGRLLAADASLRSGNLAGARTLRESALALVRGVTGTRDKRVLAAEARALLALGRLDEARPIVTGLWKSGFRHPLLVRAWTAKGGEPLGPS